MTSFRVAVSKAEEEPTRAATKSISYFVKWFNALGEWQHKPLTPKTLAERLRDGQVLCRLVEIFFRENLKGVNRRPLTRAPCVSNLEIALRAVWQKNVCSGHMASSEDFYEGRIAKIAPCLLECLEVFRFRDARANSRTVLDKMSVDLALLGRQLSQSTLANPAGLESRVVPDFADGTRLALWLALYGIVPAEDLLGPNGMRGNADQRDEHVQNLTWLCNVIKAAGLPLYLTPAEFLAPPVPCPETLLLQLVDIFYAVMGNDWDQGFRVEPESLRTQLFQKDKARVLRSEDDRRFSQMQKERRGMTTAALQFARDPVLEENDDAKEMAIAEKRALLREDVRRCWDTRTPLPEPGVVSALSSPLELQNATVGSQQLGACDAATQVCLFADDAQKLSFVLDLVDARGELLARVDVGSVSDLEGGGRSVRFLGTKCRVRGAPDPQEMEWVLVFAAPSARSDAWVGELSVLSTALKDAAVLL